MAYIIRAGGVEGCAWVAARTGVAFTPRARSVVACRPDRPDVIRAAVLLDDWTQNSAQAHVAAESAIAWRRLVPEVLRYVFRGARFDGHSGVGVLLAGIRSDNTAALRFVSHAGFEFEHRVSDVFGPGVDLVMLILRREWWESTLSPDRMVA
jgi:hypothetical protein